jgi:hypothetical protein
LILAVVCIHAGMPAAQAGVVDAANDFVPTYLGPHNGDLDVRFAEVLLDGSNFTLHAIVNGPVGTTAGGFYVWGFDRGRHTEGFPNLGNPPIAPGVLFDTVIVVRPTGVNGGTVVVNGNEITAILPRTIAALAPLPGLLPQEQFTFNLWPRSPAIPGGPTDSNLADFAPDNSDASVTVVPEPSTIALLSAAGLGLAAYRRRRRPA